MSAEETFFSDLLAAEGPMVEPHQADPLPEALPIPSYRKGWLLPVAVVTLVSGLSINSKHHSNADESTAIKATRSTESVTVSSINTSSQEAIDAGFVPAREVQERKFYGRIAIDMNIDAARRAQDRGDAAGCLHYVSQAQLASEESGAALISTVDCGPMPIQTGE